MEGGRAAKASPEADLWLATPTTHIKVKGPLNIT